MSTIKKYKNSEKNIGKVYSPSGKFAERAKKEKEINARKIYSPSSKFVERAK